jgi:hypothetical protein
MDKLVKQLKLARQDLEDKQTYSAKILQQIQQTALWKEYEFAKQDEDKAKVHLVEVDETVRIQALNVYFQTNNKKPADGVSIIIGKNLNYNPNEARAWAIEYNPNLLELNTRNFERYAKAVLDVTPLEFVTVEEVPSVRIAKEL